MIIGDINTIMMMNTIPLPAGYRLCNYIEALAGQYARPNVIPDQNTRIVIDYMSFKNSGESFQVPIGARLTTGQLRTFQFYIGSAQNVVASVANIATSNTLDTQFIVNNGDRHIYDLSATSFKIDGVDYGAPYVTNALTASVGLNFYVFARNNSDSPAAQAHGRVYSFKVYQSGVLAYDYRPVVKYDGTAGIYNILLQGSGTVVGSASGTRFTYG